MNRCLGDEHLKDKPDPSINSVQMSDQTLGTLHLGTCTTPSGIQPTLQSYEALSQRQTCQATISGER